MSGAQALDGWAVHWHHDGSKVGRMLVRDPLPIPIFSFPSPFLLPSPSFLYLLSPKSSNGVWWSAVSSCDGPWKSTCAEAFLVYFETRKHSHSYRLTLSSKHTTAKYRLPPSCNSYY